MKPANPRLAALRAAKAALLPRAAEMAGAGRSYQEIAAALGIARSTVCDWLRDQPLGRAAARSLGTPRMTARLAARYESLYHRSLREWNRSRTDRRTESVVTIEPADGSPTVKTTTVRTEPRIGSAACLGKALAATQALEGLHRRERTRQERLASDAAGNKDGLTQTVKTTLTPAGRKVQTVVTTRSGAGGLAALPDFQETLDENRRDLETRPAAAEDQAAVDEAAVDEAAVDEAARAALTAQAAAAMEELHIAEAQLQGFDFGSVRRSATLPNEVFQKGGTGTSAAEGAPLAAASGSDIHRAVPAACGSARAHSLANASGHAGSVNAGPAKKQRDWRKSFVPRDLHLQLDELSSVPRSATLPNEVVQKRGRGKARGQRSESRSQRAAGRDQRPPVGSAESLARELDLALGGQRILPAD